jgi:hypothetical protein
MIRTVNKTKHADRRKGKIKMTNKLFTSIKIGVLRAATEKEIREAAKTGASITLYGFENQEAAEAFTTKFPKYVKARAGKTISCIKANFGEDRVTFDGFQYACFTIRVNGMPTNEKTGEFNEAGEKRLNKLIEVLKKENLI